MRRTADSFRLRVVLQVDLEVNSLDLEVGLLLLKIGLLEEVELWESFGKDEELWNTIWFDTSFDLDDGEREKRGFLFFECS